MLKKKKFSLIIVATLLLMVMMATPALAWQAMHPNKNDSSSATVVIKSGQVVNDDLFLAGERVNIDGTVNGDVVVFANSVDVNGTINGDLLVGCNTLNMAGVVNDDLRIGAQNVRITGQVKRNLSAAASQLLIDKDTIVGGNVAIGSEDLDIAGLIQGNLQAAVGSLNFSGKINQSVKATTNDLNVLAGAVVGGSLSYRGDNKGNISPQAQIGGPVTYKFFVPQHQDKEKSPAEPWVGILLWILVWFMSLMLVWLLWFYLTPSSFIKVERVLKSTPWAALGWGFAILVLLPIAAILTFVTVVGIPIGLGAITAYTATLFMGKLIVGYALVYNLAVKYEIAFLQKPFAAAALGTLALMLLNLIPVVGAFITLVVGVLALGSVFVALKNGLAERKATA